MIIGFDASRAFVKNRTGTEEYSYQLLKALSRYDRVNKYLLFVRPDAKIEEFPNNFEFHTINWPRLWTQLGLAQETFRQPLDMLFVPSHTLPIIRKPGLKTIITVHDLGSEYLPRTHQMKQRLYLGFVQRYQLKTADHIIAVSNATKTDLIKKLKLSSSKISVTLEGFDEQLYQRPQSTELQQVMARYGLMAGGYFLGVGTVQPRKNLDRVIKAFAKYLHSTSLASSQAKDLIAKSPPKSFKNNKSTQLGIVGQKGWMSDRIYELPKLLGIEESVKFLGYVPELDLPALYAGSIAFLYPSLFEGFGLPILEAQACGCPVITSNLSSMPEVALLPTGGGAVLVNPYQVDDIAQALELVQNRSLRSDLVKKGFENIKRFSWKKCAEETLAVFNKLR